MADPLLVVDVQNGFLNDFTRHVPGRIVRLIERGDYEPILFTRFVNPPGSPYHRFLRWHGCVGEPETDLAVDLLPYVRGGEIFTKPGYAGISDDLAEFLVNKRFSQIAIAGIDTDMCVLKVAMDIFDLGIRPLVLTDCCASTAGLQTHLAGLAVLARNIGADQLLDAGLNDGRLAAPLYEDA